jgi:hypothetical protein
MISPITGKDMVLKNEVRIMPFRSENYSINFQYWLCEDSQEQFEDELLAESNIQQVYEQYRAKNGVAFTPSVFE